VSFFALKCEKKRIPYDRGCYKDVIRAISEAIQVIKSGKHDPFRAHERIKTFYNWEDVAVRTERVYDAVLKTPQLGLMERIERFVKTEKFVSFFP